MSDRSLALLLVAVLAGCKGALPEEHAGFWFPEEGRVVDLTHRPLDAKDARVTTIAVRGELAKLEPGRCVAPIYVVDVRDRAVQSPAFVLEVEDLTLYEKQHGAIEAGSIVLLETGGARRAASSGAPSGEPDRRDHPGFGAAAVTMLARQRGAAGFGSDAPALDGSRVTGSPARDAALAAGAFVLVGLDRLDQVVDGRAIGIVAPPVASDSTGPARVFALAQRSVGKGTKGPR